VAVLARRVKLATKPLQNAAAHGLAWAREEDVVQTASNKRRTPD